MSRPKPPHSRELKLEAVRRVLESGLPQNQVARELGLSPNTHSRWKRQYQAEQKEAFPGKGRQTSQAALVSSLRRENERLRQERDFLKKTVIYFANAKGSDTG